MLNINMPILHHQFATSALYREKPESLKGFLSKRWSFWLALFSCVAFLVGNMVGQHGWRAFWKSVWGKEEVAIVFTGTVSPLPAIPDPSRWSPAANHEYTYADVPKELLTELPAYRPVRGCGEHTHDRSILSVDYNGDYDSGGANCGSHPAADILTPKGTPVVAVMNGIVDRIEKRSWGFGNTIVIRHPNVPDPDHPERKITLYSSYAHLGNLLVSAGDIVNKGDHIAFSGQTGLATAPHLHFQIDREAPFHPYWPFTTSEATREGLSFFDAVNEGLGKEKSAQHTVNPLAYVQAFQTYEPKSTVVVQEEEPAKKVVENKGVKERVLASIRSVFWGRRDARKAARLARRDVIALHGEEIEEIEDQLEPLVVPSTAETDIPMPKVGSSVASITILHDGEFHRGWEQLVLFARDRDGRFVQDVVFEGEIYLDLAFGEASFSPSAVSAEQFDDRGRAIIRMLPRPEGRRAIVPAIRGSFVSRGEPLVFNPAEEVRDEHIASAELQLQQEEESQ